MDKFIQSIEGFNMGENMEDRESESPGVFSSLITAIKDRLEISRFKRRVREATSYLAPLPRKDSETIFKEREKNRKLHSNRERLGGMGRLESIVEVDESVIVVEEELHEDELVITKAMKVDRMTSIRLIISRLSLYLKARRPVRVSSKKSSRLNTTSWIHMDSISSQNDDEGEDEKVTERGKTDHDSVIMGKARRVSRYRTLRCLSRVPSQFKNLLKM